MMILQRVIVAISCILMLLSILQCANQNSGIETTNGAVVYVHTEGIDGVAPPYSIVYLFDKNYIPLIDNGLGIATVADKNGKFSFKGLKYDTVSLTMFSSDLTNGAYLDVGAADSRYDAMLDGKGILNGAVTASDTDMILIYIPGTLFYSLQRGSGPFVIPSLPGGTYKVNVALLEKSEERDSFIIKKETTSQNVTIVSGKTESVFFTVQ